MNIRFNHPKNQQSLTNSCLFVPGSNEPQRNCDSNKITGARWRGSGRRAADTRRSSSIRQRHRPGERDVGSGGAGAQRRPQGHCADRCGQTVAHSRQYCPGERSGGSN